MNQKSETVHAILSPSSAERWLNCTPSARLEETFADKPSEFAQEGTLAHTLGETLIRYKLNQIDSKAFTKVYRGIRENPLFSDSMLEYMDDYATYVLEQFSTAQVHTKDAVIFLEKKLNLTDYVPDGWGTGDAIIVADGVMDLTDLKYGKGVPVSCENNRQMMLYALGALRELDYIYAIDSVRLTVYQPRIGNISTWEISVQDLVTWAEDELKPRAEMAFKGEGEYVPGKHCQFCKAKPVCRAIADYNMELAKFDFKVSHLLEDREVAEILDRAAMFTNWIEAIEEYALDQAVNHNKKWPGYKVVEGRSNRKYADEGIVASKLMSAGFAEDLIYTKKILGITAMEKEIGKKDFAALLSDLIIKPPGKPALVPQTDKRPEYNSTEAAQEDFANTN